MKQGVFIKVPPACDGAAEKIAKIFMERAKVSFVRDIAPVLLEEHKYKALDVRICTEALEEIERALDIVRDYGRILKCVPQFQPMLDGRMYVSDMIYKQEKPPVVEYIEMRVEGGEPCRECVCLSCNLFGKDDCPDGADHCAKKCGGESRVRVCSKYSNEREG